MHPLRSPAIGIARFGGFTLDLRTGELTCDGGPPQVLPDQPFRILAMLVARPGDLVTREDIRQALWPNGTVVEFEHSINAAVNRLRQVLADSAESPQFIETLARRGYRWKIAVEWSADAAQANQAEPAPLVDNGQLRNGVSTFERLARLVRVHPYHSSFASITAVAALAASFFWLSASHTITLAAEDLVLVGDFENKTGEPIFDGTLKRAVTVKLGESPYFNLMAEPQIKQMLKAMNRSETEPLLPPISRQLCQRAAGRIVVGGSVANTGARYVLELSATNCQTGASLARVTTFAADRGQILAQLDKALSNLRRDLGEPAGVIERFDTPIELATTKSLPALKAVASGDEKRSKGLEAESIPDFKLATELDPDFAMAYARLAVVTGNLSQPDVSDAYMREAFKRREHVSEKEKFQIQAKYYEDTLREPENAIETYKVWASVYPNDTSELSSEASAELEVGRLSDAVQTAEHNAKLRANQALAYANLARAYERSSRFSDAKLICEKAVAEKLDSFWTYSVLFRVAFVENDSAGMQRSIDWARGKPQESNIIYYQARTALVTGQLRTASLLFDRARRVAEARSLDEQIVAMLNDQAQFEAEMGETGDAKRLAEKALQKSRDSGRHRAFAILALARSGDTSASALLAELKQHPLPGTGINSVVIPSIQAAIALNRHDASAAVEHLRSSLPYDFGTDASGMTIYYRGLALLAANSPREAALEFEKILANRGVVATNPYWPLAHLGLARCYRKLGETEKSLSHYRDVLEIWKRSDGGFPVIQQAASEYRQLANRRSSQSK